MPSHGIVVVMPGDTLSNAENFFIGTTAKRFTDSVAFGGQDYFRFTLASASSFSLSLSGLSANADVELLNSAGNPVTVDTVLQRSTNEGTLPDTLNTILNPGTYYIRVFPGPPSDPTNPAGTTPSTNYTLDVRADNGISNDIVWRYNDPNNGLNGIWRFNGTSFQSAVPINPVSVNGPWYIGGTGDFNGDGFTDLLWRYTGTEPGVSGANGIWLLDGQGTLISFFGITQVADQNWQIKGVGNFDGGVGKPDIFWQNRATGDIGVWYLDDAYNLTSSAVLPGDPSLEVQALGDFNLDGNTDIIWRNINSNQPFNNYISLSTGGFSFDPIKDFLPESDQNKRMQGAGDFNGDGSPDLLWRNYSTTGANAGANEIWLLEGTRLLSVVQLQPVTDPKWVPITPFQRSRPLTLNDLGGAQNDFAIGTLNGNGIYRDAIQANDPNDYYRFTLGSRTRLSLALDGLGTNALQGNLDVQILNASGTPIAQSINPGNAAESIANLDLNPGTYTIRVFGATASDFSAYDLNLTVNNLPVLASSGPLTVNEGQSQTLSNSVLLVTDENDPPDRLVYTLITPPSLQNGSLLSNGRVLAANSTFTQADINAGRLVYQQNGSELPVDTFVFAVSDGRGGTISNTVFTVNSTPVNDPPILLSLNPVTVSEGALVTLSNTSLLVTDVEQGPALIVYTVSSLPTVGTLSLLSGTIGPLTIGSRFTQADIDNNRLGYRHNGSETTTDGFTFVVSDGAGGFLNPQTQSLSFNVTPVNDPPVLVTNVPLTVSQAGPGFITSALLRATDAELLTPAQQDQIRYTVTSLPTSGTLYFNSVARTSPFTFSQADLNAGNVLSYAQGGTPNNSDRFTFRISDGTAVIPSTGDFNYDIFIQRVASPPVLATPTPRLTLSEGSAATISTSTLQVTDPDSAPFLITYSLGSTPRSGTLLRLGTPLTAGQTFTQLDIDTNRIQYQHNGSEQPTSDAFTFTFKDENGAGPTTAQTFSIGITPVNDPPSLLTTNPQLTVTEGLGAVLNQTFLNATDPDNLAQGITYTITGSPTNGQILRSNTLVTNFTQADVNAGIIRYQQNGSESTSDSFSFSLTDAGGASGGTTTVSINVIPFNDAPGISVRNPITVSEGGVAAIDASFLLITDVDGPGPITYTLGSLPVNGSLQLGNATLSAGGTFTQADIFNGQLFYVNNGGEATSDRFTFTASDGATTGPGAPGVVPLTTFSINVTPVNDTPGVSLNTGLTISEGSFSVINGSRLNVTDPDTSAPQLTYSILSAPTNGTLLSAGVQVFSFTQAQLNAGAITYRNNGSEVTADSFTFDVTDGNTSTGPQTFDIAVIPVNDAPTLLANTGIAVDEGGTVNLSDTVLLATDVDGPSETVIYTLGTAPTRGSLVVNEFTLSAGQTFTQADISNNLVSYIDSGRDPVANDRFIFTASDGAIALSPRTFTLTVAPINDPPAISLNNGLTVTEGGSSIIRSTALLTTDPDTPAPQLTYNISSGPASGTLLSAGTQVFSFTQSQLNNGVISYRQNGSEETFDVFTFDVTDGNSSTGPQTFSIAITPVNDAPTLLANTGILVDEGGTANLSDEVLFASDPDGPSESVIFTLSALPSRGSVVLNGLTLSTGQTFTQADISNNAVSYVDSGRDPVANDRFTFTASDGSTGVLSLRTFSLTVNPINDAPIITAPATVTATEDVTFTFSGANVLSVADPDGGPAFNVQLSTSSGGTINLATTTGLTGLTGNNSSNVSFTGPLSNVNAAIRALRYRGTQDFNGTELLTINVNDNNGGTVQQIITLNVAPVNDGPTLTASTTSLSLLEDQTPAPTFSFLVNDVDAGESPLSVVLRATNGGITVNDTGTLSFDPAGANGTSVVIFTGTLLDIQTALSGVSYQSNPDYFGTDRITVSVNDQGATGAPGTTPSIVSRTLNVNVASVNDAPTFTVTGNSAINVNEDSPQQIVPFASSIFAGAINETQSLSFSIAPSSPADAALLPSLFTATPTISATTGNLTFTPRANANGTVTLQAFLVDNGGTANGGQNTSTPFTFVLEVNQVNDPPSFTRGSVPTVTEDSGPITVNNWATNISVGPTTAAANESTQVPTFIFDTSNPSLFASGPQVVNLSGNTAGLTFTPAPDANGIATVTVRVQDNGGTANGGVDTSAPQTFTINVLSVNDPPTFTQIATTIPVLEDDVQQSIQIANNIVVGPFNELTQSATFTITANSNPNLFLAASGGIAPTIDPQGFLTFKTANNAFGSAVLTARLVDNGGTANGGVNQSAPFSFTINATGVNDAPSFNLAGTTRTVAEDAPGQTVLNWATNISPGPNEAGQQVNFVVSTDNPTLFATTGQPTIDPTGRLTYTPAANAFGTAIVTLSLVDNGGTANGGIDTSAPQSFTIVVTPVNDAPIFTNLPVGIQTTPEDQPINFTGATAIQFTDIDAGTGLVDVRLTVTNGTVLLPTTTGLTVTSGANGSSSVTFTGTLADLTAAFASVVYTPRANFNGSDTLSINVNDRGNFGSGGTLAVAGSVPITVTAVNDPPVLLNLGQLTVGEGGNANVTGALLRTTDPDNTSSQLVYTLVSTPTSGSLRLGTATIGTNGTFTQSNIDSLQLNYINNGAETTSDAFVFRVSDGTTPLPDATFNINVIPTNDPPTVVQNLGATVTEGSSVVINNTRLQVTDPDTPTSQLVYTLTNLPTSGTLRRGGAPLSLNSTFTQADLDSGLLVFQQNGSETTGDRFNFRVSDGSTAIQGTFTIAVQPVNDPPQFISQGPLTVSEGSTIPISRSILNTTDPDTPTTQLVYTVTSGLGFGQLLRNGSTSISLGGTFTQAEVDAGLISYSHNGSESLLDTLYFTVTDGTTATSPQILAINITPVNDPPTLTTNNPLTLTGNTSGVVALSTGNLSATDVDNAASEIRYVLRFAPQGALLLNGSPLAQGQAFTQADLALGAVTYRYTANIASDLFQFELLDGGGVSGGTNFFYIQFT